MLNCPLDASDKDRQETLEATNDLPDFAFNLCVLNEPLSPMSFGVGQARKLGLDHACQTAKPDDLLVCLDADCLVQLNYIETLRTIHFSNTFVACTLSFKHQHCLEDDAMAYYELMLRYMRQVLLRSDSLHSYYPMGSLMVTNVFHYQRAGGFVLKDATEDFHFLNKMSKIGHVRYFPKTCVHPSNRKSDRVYLGTGHFLSSPNQSHRTSGLIQHQDIDMIKDIHHLTREFWHHPKLFCVSTLLDDHLNTNVFPKLNMLCKNTSSIETYQKRLPQVFDALEELRILKLIHQSYVKFDFLKECALMVSLDQSNVMDLLQAFHVLDEVDAF